MAAAFSVASVTSVEEVELKMDTKSLYVLLGFIVVGTIKAVAWFFRPRPRCPECGSDHVSLIKKEPQNMTFSGFPGGGGGRSGGARFTTSIFYRVRFRCNDCQETWEKDITETK